MNPQIRNRLAEIKLRSRGEAIIPVRQIHLIGIHGKNLRLGVAPLDLQCQDSLLHFAAETAVAAVQKKISGQLHGDGAGATSDSPFHEISEAGAEHTWKVDAPVLFEMLVLDGRNSVVEYPRTLLVGHQDAALQREAAGQLAVIGVNFRDHVGTVRFQRANFRQVAGVNKQQTAARAKRNGAQHEKRERDAVNQFPAAQTQCDRWQGQHESNILTHKRMTETTHMRFDAMNMETERECLIVEGCQRPAFCLQINSMDRLRGDLPCSSFCCSLLSWWLSLCRFS